MKVGCEILQWKLRASRVDMTTFRQLNDGWNAQPNTPSPVIKVDGMNLVLSFLMNAFQFPAFHQDEIGVLRFSCCNRYLLGGTNDEGWYKGQCRFSKIAPKWGEFYEVAGDLRLNEAPEDWIVISSNERDLHHYLFYFRDETFECDAADWKLTVNRSSREGSVN
jgi:hypothetical protein